MVMAQSLFMDLHARHPKSFIAVAAPPWTAPLLARMPEVDLTIPANFSHGKMGLGARLDLARQLREYHFDRAIVLPGSIKSALAPWLARIPQRTGYRGEMRYRLINDIRPLDKQRLPLTVQRFVFLAGEARQQSTNDPPTWQSPRLVVDDESVSRSLDELGLKRPTTPLLALCPGAEFGPAKRWPSRHFAHLADLAHAAGFAVWLFGSDKDSDITRQIVEASDDACIDLAGHTNLGQAIELLSLADVVVSNDSGLMHVSAALKRPLVALYGSSSPGFTPPLSNDATILTLDLDCSPCFKRECPLGHFRCLEDLDPARVFKAVLNAIDNRPI